MRKDAGFTITEFMITMAILSIISAIAVPNYSAWRSNSKLVGASQNLRGDMEMAKLRAIRENAAVAVLFTATGYTIFIDNDTDWAIDPGELQLRNRQLDAGITIDLVATTFAGDRTRFDGRGLPGVLGTVVIVGSAGTRQISMNRLGRLLEV